MIGYLDREWGVSVCDDSKLFDYIVLNSFPNFIIHEIVWSRVLK